MKKQIAAIAGIATLFLGACAPMNKPAEVSTETKRLNIVTSFYPVYEFTKQVVGEEANVNLLIGAGTEAHGYEPSAKDVATISEADAFVYLNENLETWAPSVIESLKDSKVKIVKATEGMKLMAEDDHDHEAHSHDADDHSHDHEGESHDHDHDGHDHHDDKDKQESHDHDHESHHHEFDPHVWLSPKKAVVLVETIRDYLSATYPEKAEIFKANADKYSKELNALDKEFETALANAKEKTFVTQHAAFGYLAEEYDLEQVAINGITPDAEPSPARLAELAKFVKDNHVHYIYFEENASEKIAKTLADEAGVQLEVLNPLESLTEEQMQKGENYISIMKANLQALLKTTNH